MSVTNWRSHRRSSSDYETSLVTVVNDLLSSVRVTSSYKRDPSEGTEPLAKACGIDQEQRRAFYYRRCIHEPVLRCHPRVSSCLSISPFLPSPSPFHPVLSIVLAASQSRTKTVERACMSLPITSTFPKLD